MIDYNISLFSDRQIGDILQKHREAMFAEIDEIDGSSLLNTDVDEWCDFFEERFTIKVPQLKEDEIHTAQKEVLIPVINVYEGNIQELGTKFSFFIPFEGNRELFKIQPSPYVMIGSNPIQADLNEFEIVLSYERLNPDLNEIKASFNRGLANIKENLNYIHRQVSSCNNSIREQTKSRIQNRRQKLFKDQELITQLGFPIRKRDNAPLTYVVPTVRKKISVAPPSASTPPFIPEPTLDMKEYEHILSVISNMVIVMERSPKAFKGMGEEDLRQHFLVQLNGQYEGQATGETFNFNGKTDILIRLEGKNIFIAECKFWHGEEKFKETLEQLLGYTSWRDTKIALLMFNRNKDFSNVVKQIPEIIKSHSNFKRELPYDSETGFRSVLHHPDDVNRELILTTLAFNVPQ